MGGFRRGRTPPPPQGFDPLPTQKARTPPAPPLYYFEISIFCPKNFLKAPLASIYTNFEGGASAKKNAILRSKFSK